MQNFEPRPMTIPITTPVGRTTFTGVALAAALLVPPAFAEAATEDRRIVTAHGISTFGELKYPAGYGHFDFVNPEAPKGGELSTWGFGTFDSFNRFIVKGEL